MNSELSPIVELNGVTLERDGVVILRDVSWRVQANERWLLFGPNGCGKTSLLRVMNGYEWPNVGRMALFGETLGDGAHLPTIRRAIGIVSSALAPLVNAQRNGLEVALTGIDAWLNVFRDYTAEEMAAAEGMLLQVGAEHLAARPYGRFSQGERQRVLIARALMARPKLLVLDEPCAGLDPAGREAFLDDLSSLMAKPDAPGLIFVTHHLEEARDFMTHAFLMREGARQAAGKIDEVMTAGELTRLFGRACRPVRTEAGRLLAFDARRA